MKTQSHSNHRRFVPLFHFVTSGLVAILFIASLVYAGISLRDGESLHLVAACLLVLVGLISMLFFIFMRLFALRAQDRAIRAEENLRHFVLTGHLLDRRLRIGQVIALRFAPDEELAELARQAAEQDMTPAQIKQAIRTWRGDYHRV